MSSKEDVYECHTGHKGFKHKLIFCKDNIMKLVLWENVDLVIFNLLLLELRLWLVKILEKFDQLVFHSWALPNFPDVWWHEDIVSYLTGTNKFELKLIWSSIKVHVACLLFKLWHIYFSRGCPNIFWGECFSWVWDWRFTFLRPFFNWWFSITLLTHIN